MTYNEFIEIHRETLLDYWKKIEPKLIEWKHLYQWQGVDLAEAITKRNQLENAINNDITSKGYLTKPVFDDVMKWGFGKSSNNSDKEIQAATKEAFYHLHNKRIADAALALIKLDGIGISRASKILALSNQDELAIYDSHAANGLSGLIHNSYRIIPIPPGRKIKGDSLSQVEFCKAFEKYIWILTFLRNCAQANDEIGKHFRRVADLEIAFFSKSRIKAAVSENRKTTDIQNDVKVHADDCYWTLGSGKKSKPFWAYMENNGIKILTGQKRKTELFLSNQNIESCLKHFSTIDWFPLGNTIDNIKPNGLGEYFKNTLKKSPKFASHYAAILVHQGRLKKRDGKRNVELKVIGIAD